ncbi:hypothetical protein [Ottowia sp.]|uniref:hypothetical protein n=1 Tax=Ottowia sp. TaxID=1898956 RepID=UPI0025F5CD60|nr:hypothetical protein [Ottowia sp.]MBK6616375.1 hypothetical protein [Ottowia sp.]
MSSPLPNNVTLASGRVVTHRRGENGAAEAFMEDGGSMSNGEWSEYVGLRVPPPPFVDVQFETACGHTCRFSRLVRVY